MDFSVLLLLWYAIWSDGEDGECVLISKFRYVLNVIFFFSVISQCLNCICERFGTLGLFHLHRQCKQEEGTD